MKTKTMSPLEFCEIAIASANRAERLHGPIQSNHHAHGILLEEIEEYWDEVRKRHEARDYDAIFNELVDIGTCCVRWNRFRGQTDADLQAAVGGPLWAIVERVQSLHEGYSLLLQGNLVARSREPFPWVLEDTGIATAATVLTVAAAIAVQVVVPMKAINGCVRRICGACGQDLPGSDITSPILRHGLCAPLCAEAQRMGWETENPVRVPRSEVLR